ncbi:vasoactive intestinal polypeptide receptor 2-like [Chanos chanos]|uniref:Vasoactive intestinal polypeptide receptor 2-like n=1 Tax=Chanos chanos TaxID=29144 RepID=A0A6J2VDA0_CHACN|nr:vasoactive intestinal polypeptide receptor 2-like [Chanos chanos]
MTSFVKLLFLFMNLLLVCGRHPTCNFYQELRRAKEECQSRLQQQDLHTGNRGPGCKGYWDNISCWDGAEVGQTVTIPCPPVLKTLFGRHGYISKNCTTEGWSDVFPNITSVCGSETAQDKLIFYMVVRILYTLGHSLSLIALITGSAILCLFRRLHCMRNYIHLNLFLSFILRAVAVLVKDSVLFSHSTHCSQQSSLVGCRMSIVVFHYFIMANFLWLLVEGLYLHTLLMVLFSENRHFRTYLLIGWGVPAMFVFAWVLARHQLEDTGCWEQNDHPVPMWVINGPIGFSIMVNFVLFISIIRILVQKLRCPDVGGSDQSQYRRLAKSTLLLIPLFGIHYVVFVSLNESMADYKIFFDLAMGSFQGLVVAILYCFLNSEVQTELRRKWSDLSGSCCPASPSTAQDSCATRNGSDRVPSRQRSGRTASLLQTETTVLESLYPTLYSTLYLTLYLTLCPTLYLTLYPTLYLTLYPTLYLTLYPTLYLTLYLTLYPNLYLTLYPTLPKSNVCITHIPLTL